MKTQEKKLPSLSHPDEDYIHYMYKITNKNNGKYYIGIHSLYKLTGLTPLTDGYWGSGKNIVKAIKEEGRTAFKKEILKIFSTREEMSAEEKKIVTPELLRDPNCYNKIIGGDHCGQLLGMIPCSHKENLQKVILVTREEYYKHKGQYVLCVDKLGERKKRRNPEQPKYQCKQKRDAQDTLYCRKLSYVNKDTLDIKTYVGHDKPDNLYTIWFPVYFLDKVNNVFITKDYFLSLFKKEKSLRKLSKSLKTSLKSLAKIRDFYDLEKEFILINRRVINKNNGTFLGKAWVSKDGVSKVISKDELDSYIDSGYYYGNSTKPVIIDEEAIINDYISGNYTIFELRHKHDISDKNIKLVLGLNKFKKISGTWFHNDSIEKSILLCVSDKIRDRIFSAGWLPGKKKY